MKTPLFFKLLLLLALGFRLIRAARKTPDLLQKKTPFRLNRSKSTFSIPNIQEQESSVAFMLYFYRTNVRPLYQTTDDFSGLPLVYQMAVVLHEWYQSVSKKKKGIFRFFWYKEPWIFVFYEVLDELQLTEEGKVLAQIMTEVAETDQWNEQTTFVLTGGKEYPTMQRFDELFDENHLFAIFKKYVMKWASAQDYDKN
ncbi:MAG: hypothetical protein ACK4UP_11055 [Spirosomataceae bacterium]